MSALWSKGFRSLALQVMVEGVFKGLRIGIANVRSEAESSPWSLAAVLAAAIPSSLRVTPARSNTALRRRWLLSWSVDRLSPRCVCVRNLPSRIKNVFKMSQKRFVVLSDYTK